MTRLDRLLNLLENYDDLASWHFESQENTLGHEVLMKLRKEKDQLRQELIEYGCRRRD